MMDKILVYIAGPLSNGDWMVNLRNAIDAQKAVRRLGAVAVVPHLSAFAHLVHAEEYETWLAEDFTLLERCDVLLRLPGESEGSDREVIHARRAGVHVVRSLDELAKLIGRAP